MDQIPPQAILLSMSNVACETWMGRTTRERAEARREIACTRAHLLLERLDKEGVEARVIGSLAKGLFRTHSDVDFLIRSSTVTPERRALVERVVASCMRGSGIPYDLVYASDIAPERLKEFEHDLL